MGERVERLCPKVKSDKWERYRGLVLRSGNWYVLSDIFAKSLDSRRRSPSSWDHRQAGTGAGACARASYKSSPPFLAFFPWLRIRACVFPNRLSQDSPHICHIIGPMSNHSPPMSRVTEIVASWHPRWEELETERGNGRKNST